MQCACALSSIERRRGTHIGTTRALWRGLSHSFGEVDEGGANFFGAPVCLWPTSAPNTRGQHVSEVSREFDVVDQRVAQDFDGRNEIPEHRVEAEGRNRNRAGG